MTTYPTITGFGANGTSGDKRAGEDFLRNRKRRKRLFPNGKAFPPPFGSRMPWVQVPPLRPELRNRPRKSRRDRLSAAFRFSYDRTTAPRRSRRAYSRSRSRWMRPRESRSRGCCRRGAGCRWSPASRPRRRPRRRRSRRGRFLPD